MLICELQKIQVHGNKQTSRKWYFKHRFSCDCDSDDFNVEHVPQKASLKANVVFSILGSWRLKYLLISFMYDFIPAARCSAGFIPQEFVYGLPPDVSLSW